MDSERVAPKSPPSAGAIEELSKPRVARWEVVQALLSLFDGPRYLEVGVSSGGTFHNVDAAFQVAVDPLFRFDCAVEEANRNGRAKYYELTSDEYFGSIIDPDQLFDVIYLDGLHTFEQTLRDLTNALHHLALGGVILIDDVKPSSYHASLPERETFGAVRKYVSDKSRAWMGDVYKLVWFIDTFYQSLSYATVANNHGQAVVWRERRAHVTERSAAEVATMSFGDFVVSRATLRLQPLDEIVHSLSARAGRR